MPSDYEWRNGEVVPKKRDDDDGSNERACGKDSSH